MSKTQKKKQHKRRAIKYDTDVAAKNIWLSLLRDFRSTEGVEFASKAHDAFMGGIPNYRDYQYPELGIISPARFKRYKQLESFLKKYRFSVDKYTDEELDLKTHQKFFDEQEHFATYKPITMLSHRVLQCARKHAGRILGSYDPEYTVTESKFGKKSSIGCPLSLAYIDHKLTDAKAFTGAKECSKWFFEEVLPGDPILAELVGKLGVSLNSTESLQHESLNLVNVPKSWTTHRPITPLTLLSLMYSYGVGEQVTRCLEDEGLDIARLQHRHRGLVKKFSGSRTHATADLSSASQSLLSDLLNRVLPREWYCAMKKTFSHQLVVNTVGQEGTYYTESVLPMGNGLTFPTETLVFYCILKAIAELSGVRGLISVYGDDLIYPSRLHKYVAVIFPQLKFKLNLDKTFVKAPFRESCGSDFYRTVDVRPSFLPGEHQMLTRTKYVVWLYKTYNALVRRWDELEIRSTLYYLLTEISRTGLKLHRVPPSYPDTAGIKVENPGVIPLDAHVLDWYPVVVRYYSGSIWHKFSYLSVQPDKRVVASVLPYYWLALQGLTDDPKDDNFWDTDYSALQESPRRPLTWTTLKRERFVKTSTGKRRRFFVTKQLAECTSRTGSIIQTKTTKKQERRSTWL